LYIIVEHRKSNAKAKLMEVLRCIARSVAKRFQKTLSLYRRKFILFIPWAFDEVLDDIFYLISEFKDEEIDELLFIYESPQKRNLIEFQPSSFIKVCNKYNPHQSKPILKGLCERSKRIL